MCAFVQVQRRWPVAGCGLMSVCVYRYSCSGRLLAVAVNQRDSDVTRLVYLGAGGGQSRPVLVADMYGAGATGIRRRHQRSVTVVADSVLSGYCTTTTTTKHLFLFCSVHLWWSSTVDGPAKC